MLTGILKCIPNRKPSWTVVASLSWPHGKQNNMGVSRWSYYSHNL